MAQYNLGYWFAVIEADQRERLGTMVARASGDDGTCVARQLSCSTRVLGVAADCQHMSSTALAWPNTTTVSVASGHAAL